MIFIPVDPGAAFDILSIALIKYNKNVKDYRKAQAYSRIVRFALASNIGDDKCVMVIGSPEYHDLYSANEAIFKAEEKARTEPTEHGVIRELNMKRYAAKVALQKKFFPDEEVTEKKTMAQ